VMNANLDFDDLHMTQANGTPVVLCMWERPNDPPGLPCVAVDFRLAGKLAARHLIELGHERIGAIVGSKSMGIHASRYDGFLDAMGEAGLEVVEANTLYAPDTVQGGYAATLELLERDPRITAIFATNDLPALGAIDAAADLKRSVPQELSVIGVTDIQLAQQWRPPLTTVAVPTVEAAGLAVALLREMIEEPQRVADQHFLRSRVLTVSDPRLIVRGSTTSVHHADENPHSAP